MITEKLNSGIRQGAAFYKEFAALAVPLVLIRVLDTSVNLIDGIFVAIISLPLLFISGMVFKVSIEAAFGLTLVEIVIKSFFVRWRITRYSWAKNLVSEPQKA